MISFNKVVDVRVSLSSASCSSKLVEPEEGVVETSDLLPNHTEVVGTLGTYYLQLAAEEG